MDNLEEMDRLLEKFNLRRLYQEEIEIMNNPITSTETEAVIKKISPKNKSPGLSPLMRPTKCPDTPVSLKRNTEVFPHHFL